VFMSHLPRFQFSHHNPGPTVCIPHFLRFSQFFAIFQVLQCVFLFCTFFNVSRHIPGITVCISHFYMFSFSHHIPGPTMWVSHFPFWNFSQRITDPTVCVFHFPCISFFFLPYSRSYSVHFSFFTFF
jgi:hypothetical protein